MLIRLRAGCRGRWPGGDSGRRARSERRPDARWRHRQVEVSDAARGERVEHRVRSEEHTSELQSLTNLVCRLLLEKKKKPCRTRTPPLMTRPSTPSPWP